MQRKNKLGDTFSVTVAPVSWKKSEIGEWFINSAEYSQIAVGEEKYSEKLDCDTGEVIDGEAGRHQHIYLKSIEKIKCVDVVEMVKLFFPEEEISINVQSCRSSVHWLRYLSKEDKSPFLFNVPVSKLSLYARSWHHAKTKYRTLRPIDVADPFVIAAGPHYRNVINIISEHLSDLRRFINNNRHRYPINLNCLSGYDALQALQSGGHVYLEGVPGVGKTELVDEYIRNKVYYKVNDYNQYCFAGLREDSEVLWFEDFDYEKWKIISSTILGIMDGKEVCLQAKYLPDRLVSFKLQVIFTSNFTLGATSDYFIRRVKHVYFDHPMKDCICRPISPSFDVSTQEIFDDLEDLFNMNFL